MVGEELLVDADKLDNPKELIESVVVVLLEPENRFKDNFSLVKNIEASMLQPVYVHLPGL